MIPYERQARAEMASFRKKARALPKQHREEALKKARALMLWYEDKKQVVITDHGQPLMTCQEKKGKTAREGDWASEVTYGMQQSELMRGYDDMSWTLLHAFCDQLWEVENQYFSAEAGIARALEARRKREAPERKRQAEQYERQKRDFQQKWDSMSKEERKANLVEAKRKDLEWRNPLSKAKLRTEQERNEALWIYAVLTEEEKEDWIEAFKEEQRKSHESQERQFRISVGVLIVLGIVAVVAILRWDSEFKDLALVIVAVIAILIFWRRSP